MAEGGGEVSGPTQDWFDDARDLAVFDLDVFYETPEYCPNWLLPYDRQHARVPVKCPNLPNADGGVLTADVAGREAELVLYYARLPALPPPERQSDTARWNCFDVGLLLRSGNDIYIYADAFGGGHLETEEILEHLADLNRPPDCAYDNLDQGWALQIHVQERHVVFIYWDWECADPRASATIVRLDRAEVARQARAARWRMAVLQPLLIEVVGHDLWRARPTG